MVKKEFALPQSLADDHTLIAQNYAGYFVGHPYQAAQQRTGPTAIVVDESKEWKEPLVVADDCEFCQHLTDAEAERRVLGFQSSLDREALRTRANLVLFEEWRDSKGVPDSNPLRRRFFATQTTDEPPIPLVDLPLRLKRKMCIEWNHIYRDWLAKRRKVWYDFRDHRFYIEVDEEGVPDLKQEIPKRVVYGPFFRRVS